jgi:hypothetical protein
LYLNKELNLERLADGGDDLYNVPVMLRISKHMWLILISGFRRDVDEICGLLGYYTASRGNYLPTFRDNVSVPSSRVKIPSRKKNLDP